MQKHYREKASAQILGDFEPGLRNPKNEGRNPKEVRTPSSEVLRGAETATVPPLRTSALGFASDFGLRPSDLFRGNVRGFTEYLLVTIGHHRRKRLSCSFLGREVDHLGVNRTVADWLSHNIVDTVSTMLRIGLPPKPVGPGVYGALAAHCVRKLRSWPLDPRR